MKLKLSVHISENNCPKFEIQCFCFAKLETRDAFCGSLSPLNC